MCVVCRMYGLFQTTFYFGYMALFSLALGIMCGQFLFSWFSGRPAILGAMAVSVTSVIYRETEAQSPN